jgi:hypothetical protein
MWQEVCRVFYFNGRFKIRREKCELHPLIHTFSNRVFTPGYGSWISRGKVWIKVCNVNFREKSRRIYILTSRLQWVSKKRRGISPALLSVMI